MCSFFADASSCVAPLIQELSRRYDALDAQMDILKAETENGENKLGKNAGESTSPIGDQGSKIFTWSARGAPNFAYRLGIPRSSKPISLGGG